MTLRVLVLNVGSSTLKASVLSTAEEPDAAVTVPMAGAADASAALWRALDGLRAAGVDLERVDAVGHRVVHGGQVFTRATRIDDAVVAGIRELAPLAPLHNPAAAEVIAAARARFGERPEAACFDTAFHATLPAEAYTYAIPREWSERWGYRRYGFHGLSVAWSVERAAVLLARPAGDLGLVVAHLGAGCSVTAAWGGRSAHTTMGMTPLEGVVMATRAGSIDPGILIAAQRDHAIDVASLEDTLDHRSGLLALGGTADMKTLLAREGEPDAMLALAVFTRSVAAAIAAAATAIPRLDALVFTGGIGEHAAAVRADVCRRLAVLGVPAVAAVAVDADAVIARDRIAVLRIAAREDAVIAREVRTLLAE